MVRPADTVYVVVRAARGLIVGARLAEDSDDAPWALPAGPVGEAGPRASAAAWCVDAFGLDVSVGHLLAVRFVASGASVFVFDGTLREAAVAESPRHGVVVRSFRPEELSARLPEFERGALTAALQGAELGRVVEWSAGGEVAFQEERSWRRMMPALPAPFGPLIPRDMSRAARYKTSRTR
ncbi:hypothetical protein [Falsarthrobacter nasiphocae]|uniref:Uncharacterized protein n=1 Tax=Falsarthrobacter nasiphocae TaxID=189863 RepID=A0AAE3YIW0_9MICC|nr:hypothetical protein [Falsarthrobacter nasiphocae]MDR6892856.1 hypothetical protein [Falsarthrobacter nasiphocae]